MKITERDIFNFVFYNDLLSTEKREYIEESGNFSKGIRFYQSLKEAINQNLSVEIKNFISEKIPAYNPIKFKLYPIKDVKSKKKNSNLTLAADSPETNTKMEASTFIDEEKRYLAKLLVSDKSSKIYVFSTNDEQLENYKLIIHPSNKIFEQINNSQPLIVDSPIEVSSIEIQFN